MVQATDLDIYDVLMMLTHLTFPGRQAKLILSDFMEM